MVSGIWLLAIGQLFCWSALYFIFPAALLSWEEHYGWQRSELTLAFTLAVSVSALLSPLAGRIVDDGKAPLLIPLSALCGSLLLCSLAWVESLWLFTMIWVLIGACLSGCLYDPCFALLIRHQDLSARRGISIITLVAGFAGTLTFPGVHLLQEWFGQEVMILSFGMSGIMIAAPCLLLGSRKVARDKVQLAPVQTTLPPASGIWNRPLFLLLTAAFALLALIHSMVLSHLLPILDEFDVEQGNALFAIALIGPMQVIGRLVSMILEQRVQQLHYVDLGFDSSFDYRA